MNITQAGKARVAMLLWNPCTHDSRVIKEAETLARAGYEVRVFCLAEPGLPRLEQRNGVTYARFPMCRSVPQLLGAALGRASPNTVAAGAGAARAAPSDDALPERGTVRRALRPLWRALITPYRRLGSPLGKPLRNALPYATLGPAAIAFAPAVVHAHDQITLWAGSVVAKRTGAKLIYDSHEYSLHVQGGPTVLARLQEWLHERAGIRKADAVITVSRSIAGRLKADYGVRRPTIIYNAPTTARNAWPSDVRADARIPADAKLAVYVGGLAKNRGIENVVRALRYLEDFHLVSLGPPKPDYEARLRSQASADGTAGRLHFLKAVPAEALIPYLRSADVGVIAYQNVCLNHEYCMPNKLFECALAGVPLAVSNLRDLRRFVTQNRIGVVMDETDPRSIAAAIRAACERQAELRPAAERLDRLRVRYSWEAQAKKLEKLYATVLHSRLSTAVEAR